MCPRGTADGVAGHDREAACEGDDLSDTPKKSWDANEIYSGPMNHFVCTLLIGNKIKTSRARARMYGIRYENRSN